jgi:hypothetical protein
MAHCLPAEGVRAGTREFTVPQEYIADVLRVLGQPRRDEGFNRGSEELAVMNIVGRDGRQVEVRLYFWGKEEAR